MKFLNTLALIILTSSVFAGEPTKAPTDKVLLIQHHTDATPAAKDASHSGTQVGELRTGEQIIKLQKGASVTDAVAKAAKDPSVKSVEEDKRIPLDGTPNDPSLTSQYHLFKINAPSAWNTSTGRNVIIAIIDSGVLSSHPDLVANMVPGWNTFNNNNDTADVSRHGTAVAGVAGAVGNNSLGIASVAYNTRIMPIRATDDTGYAYFSTVAKGLIWAADHGAKVANISIAGAASSATVNNAAAYFKSKGGVVVIAAGNDGKSLTLTTATNSIVVSATDADDVWQSYSNYGDFVTVSAPGQGILTTNREGGYSSWSKTSFAAPQVAGLAALIMSINPALTPDEIQGIIQASAVDLGTPGKDPYYGYGRINAEAAIKLATGTITPPKDTTPPVVTLSSTATGPVAGTVEVQATAVDNIGVTSVNLFVNGTLFGSLTTPPYIFSINTTNLNNGDAVIKATAVDAEGNIGESSSINLTVFNDKTPPVITVISPVNNTNLGINAAITLYSTATDNLGTAGITQTVLVDNAVKKTITGGTLSYRWYLSGVTPGTHTISFVAKDAAGNVATSSVNVVK